MLLGEVRELEVERERPQHVRLPLERKGCDGGLQPGAGRRTAGGASATREPADVLLIGEQAFAALLDENAAQDLTQ